MVDLTGDLCAGHYFATPSVLVGRRNLFSLEPIHERHIGTIVSGSRSKLERFDRDCFNIVHGLALVDVIDDVVQALTLAEVQLSDLRHAQRHRGITINATDDAMRAVTTAIVTTRSIAHGRP